MKMRRHFILIAVVFGLISQLPTSSQMNAFAATKKASVKKSSTKKSTKSKKRTATKRSSTSKETSESTSSNLSSGNELKRAMALAKAGNYDESSALLFQLSLSPRYISSRMQIRYLLGLMLYELKMHQLAAFQFIGVIRDGKSRYVSSALEKLSVVADELGDDTLLNYAISRVKTAKFPGVHKDMLYFRIGEYQSRNALYSAAVESFDKVPTSSPFYDKAMYLKAYSLAQAGNAKEAVNVFDHLYNFKNESPVTDEARVAALIGKARALYQMKNWDASIEAYREVPRDSTMWHDTIFESSWAMLRSGRFRSAISNFQSLHSPYYENSYLPESLLLRSIVYLYICQYEEMDKVLVLFNKIYRPIYNSVSDYLKKNKNSSQYFNDVVNTIQKVEKRGIEVAKTNQGMPYLMTQKVVREGDFQRSFQYIKKLIKEKKQARAMGANWRNSGIGKYAEKTLNRRIERARAKAGRQVRAHMIAVKTELIDLFEQEGFIRYEMINGKKEQLKKRVAGKDLPAGNIDEDKSRDYYIQNGYQYWKFRGEYWLDELGNYHYLGAQSCE